jgi:hypothetical protein
MAKSPGAYAENSRMILTQLYAILKHNLLSTTLFVCGTTKDNSPHFDATM